MSEIFARCGGNRIAVCRALQHTRPMLSAHTKLAIRPLRASDAGELADIFRESWHLTYDGILPRPHLDMIIDRRGAEWWAAPARKRERHLVLEFEGKIAGYASYGAARTRNRAMGEIYELYLGPIYQGLGFGEHLFEACRHQLDQARCRGLVVWALADNTQAINFYWRRGGRPVQAITETHGGKRIEKIAFTWG